MTDAFCMSRLQSFFISPFHVRSYGTHLSPSIQRLRRFIPNAKPSKSEFKNEVQNSPADLKITSSLSRQDENKEDNPVTWDWFDWQQYNTKWEVPWGVPTVLLGMVGWLASSVAVGFLAIPQFVRLTGLASTNDFSRPQRAFLLLGVQVLETLVGLSVIGITTRFYEKPASSKLFKISIRKPFETRYGWLVWALIGILLSIGVNLLVSLLLNTLGTEMSGNGTIQSVVGMLSLDLPTYIALISVVGVLAPVLEETVFRGFLLTSLTKWMPTYQAVFLSSILFGCAHLSPKDFPYLTAVGVVWGFMYVRSRNLLTPMVMHGVWNSTVLTLLFVLDSMGVDLTQLT